MVETFYDTPPLLPHPTPQTALLAYLRKTVGTSAVSGSLEISQFSHGQSNPTYFIKVLSCWWSALSR